MQHKKFIELRIKELESKRKHYSLIPYRIPIHLAFSAIAISIVLVAIEQEWWGGIFAGIFVFLMQIYGLIKDAVIFVKKQEMVFTQIGNNYDLLMGRKKVPEDYLEIIKCK